MSKPVLRCESPAAFIKAVRYALDMLEAGQISAINAVFEGNYRIGRVSFTTIDGIDVPLPEFDTSDIDPDYTPATAPGKGRR